MTSRIIVFFVSVLCCIVLSETARILAVYPTPSISHQVVFRPFTEELVRRGHEVVVLTTDPVYPKGKAPANLTEIDVHDMSYDTWRKEVVAKVTKDDFDTQIKKMLWTMMDLFFEQIQTSEFKKIIDEKQQFDLLLLEACSRSALVLSHLFKAPVIQVSSLGSVLTNYHDLGAPNHPILYPSILHQRLYNLTLFEKANNLYKEWHYRSLIDEHDQELDVKMKERFGHDTPSLYELRNNIDMLFLNIHPIWDGNTPWPPSIVHTWGIHHKPEKLLPQDLQSYLDTSKNGVIYFSFGTNVDPATLPPERIQMFIRVFSKLPYDVLWKWNHDVLPGKTENIRISKWLPQSDLLRHPNVKVFITQGGLQSTDEAIIAGVPLIGIPMLADQWYNVEKYVHHGIGLKLSIETVNEEQLTNAIKEVIDNKRYRNNIKKLSAVIRDEPMSGLQRAVWWTEHVLRHGGARHLRAPAANISWGQYLELELVSIVLIALLVIIVLGYSVLKRCYGYVSTISINVHKSKNN